MKPIAAVVGLAGILLLSGCASPSLYYWGSYENQIYKMYNEPGEMPPERQVELMEADIERARSKDKPLPPGFEAHLGFLYFQLGKFDLAKQSFEAEKAAFPESSVLMDRFIKKLGGGHA